MVRIGLVGPSGNPDASPDRVFAAPQVLRHRFANDGRRRRASTVGLVKEPAAEKRDLHRLEVIRTHAKPVGVRRLGRIGERLVFDGNARPVDVVGQRQHCRGAHADDARQRLQPHRKLVVKPGDAGMVRIRLPAQIHLHRQDAVRIEAGSDRQQPEEAAHQQPGPDEQNRRERHIHGDERRPISPGCGIRRCPPPRQSRAQWRGSRSTGRRRPADQHARWREAE
jgi:hypothetical protein